MRARELRNGGGADEGRAAAREDARRRRPGDGQRVGERRREGWRKGDRTADGQGGVGSKEYEERFLVGRAMAAAGGGVGGGAVWIRHRAGQAAKPCGGLLVSASHPDRAFFGPACRNTLGLWRGCSSTLAETMDAGPAGSRAEGRSRRGRREDTGFGSRRCGRGCVCVGRVWAREGRRGTGGRGRAKRTGPGRTRERVRGRQRRHRLATRPEQ